MTRHNSAAEAPRAGSRSDDVRSDEADLVRRVQRGEHDAFRSLMEVHMRPVRTFVALQAPAAHLIEEVAQETFVVAFTKIQDFEAQSSFSAWVRTIAWQLLRREIQRFAAEQTNRKNLGDHLSVLHGTTSASPGTQDDWVDHLHRCLRKVPDSGQQLLNLKYHRGYSADEIAQQLSRSGDWVRTNLYRIRKQLRDCILLRIDKSKYPET